jgi:hypothetical protein
VLGLWFKKFSNHLVCDALNMDASSYEEAGALNQFTDPPLGTRSSPSELNQSFS